jgi:hypothetical protein
MGTGSDGDSLRLDGFPISRDRGSVFCSSWTGYCTSVGAGSGSLAGGHRAGRVEFPRALAGSGSGTAVPHVSLEHGVPIGQLTRMQHRPPLLIFLRSQIENPSQSPGLVSLR